MSESRALLVIADIGGFTKYMTLHRIGVAHAQANVHKLLEAVVDAVPELELIEIEGDAVFLAMPDDGDAAALAKDLAVAMHRAFHERRRRIVDNLCPCEGCAQAAELRLKCIAHVGDVSEATFRDRKTLGGPAVILVHRLLKNAVPVPEYALLSEELYSETAGEARPVEQELEGLGPVRAYFFELAEPEVEAPGLGARVGETVATLGRGMPYLLGLKKTEPAVH